MFLMAALQAQAALEVVAEAGAWAGLLVAAPQWPCAGRGNAGWKMDQTGPYAGLWAAAVRQTFAGLGQKTCALLAPIELGSGAVELRRAGMMAYAGAEAAAALQSLAEMPETAALLARTDCMSQVQQSHGAGMLNDAGLDAVAARGTLAGMVSEDVLCHAGLTSAPIKA